MLLAIHCAARAVSSLCSERALTDGMRNSSKSSSRMRDSFSVKKRSRSAGTLVPAEAVSVIIDRHKLVATAESADASLLVANAEIGEVEVRHFRAVVLAHQLPMLRPHLAEDRRLSQRAEKHHEAERDRALRIGMCHLGTPTRIQQERAQLFDVVRIHLPPRRLDDGIDARPQEQASRDAALRGVDVDGSAGELGEDLSHGRAAPVLGIEQIVGAFLHLVEETLIEQMQQRVFVREASVECTDGDTRTLHDFRERCLGEALFLEHPLGSVENPVERLLTARLLRRTESRNCHRTSSHPLGTLTSRRLAKLASSPTNRALISRRPDPLPLAQYPEAPLRHDSLAILHVDERISCNRSEIGRKLSDDRMYAGAHVQRHHEVLSRPRCLGEAGPEVVLIAPTTEVERKGGWMSRNVKCHLGCVLVSIRRNPSAVS